MPQVARHLMIHGRVQGVWYRAWTVETARGLGLAGWVRNRTDGCVEALVEGEAAAVARFVALAQDGPTAAKVARIDVVEVGVEGLSGFEKRGTVWGGRVVIGDQKRTLSPLAGGACLVSTLFVIPAKAGSHLPRSQQAGKAEDGSPHSRG